MRLFYKGVRVAHKTLEETRDGLGEDHRSDLAAVENIVADRELDDLNANAAVVLRDTRVDALVASARHDDLVAARQVLNDRLRQRGSRGCRDRENATRRGLGPLTVTLRQRRGEDLVEGTRPHVRAHHHARATAVRGVIDAAMLAGRPLAQIVRLQLHKPGILRLTHEGQAKGREIVRENRDEIETHELSDPRAPRPPRHQKPRRSVDDDHTALNVDRGNERRHEGNHDSSAIRGNEEQILRCARRQATHCSEDVTGRRACLKSFEFVGIPGVLFRMGIDEQTSTAQGLRFLAGRALLERSEHAILVCSHGTHRELTLLSCNIQARARRQDLRVVAAHVHDDLSTQSVGGSDDSGCELHVFS